MHASLPVIAGFVSTILFSASTLPMLVKAFRTRDLHSYSLESLVISNLGNLVHAVYVYSLPFGPIWLLHGFYLLTSGLMLAGYVLFERSAC